MTSSHFNNQYFLNAYLLKNFKEIIVLTIIVILCYLQHVHKSRQTQRLLATALAGKIHNTRCAPRNHQNFIRSSSVI